MKKHAASSKLRYWRKLVTDGDRNPGVPKQRPTREQWAAQAALMGISVTEIPPK